MGTADGRTPAYYRGKGGMQPFDIIDLFHLGFYDGNVVKYLLRWKRKGGLEDLSKAQHYLDETIKRDQTGMRPAGGAWPTSLSAQLTRIADAFSLTSLEMHTIGYVLR